jgi:hypothetical protein
MRRFCKPNVVKLPKNLWIFISFVDLDPQRFGSLGPYPYCGKKLDPDPHLNQIHNTDFMTVSEK